MSSTTTSSYEAKDERNVVSWRVPNLPKQAETPEEADLSSVKGKDGPKSYSGDKGSSVKSDSAPSSPVDGRKGQKSPKTSSDTSIEEPKNNFGNKLWRMLFSNVIRSIDDVYVQCEEQEDKAKCQEVIELLVRSRNDFRKLNMRLDEQSKFQIGQAMSWEIRKPTLPSPMNPVSAQQTHLDLSVLEREYDERQTAKESPGHIVPAGAGAERMSGEKAVSSAADVSSTRPTDAAPKKLNAGAKPFSPTLTGVVAVPTTPQAGGKGAQKSAPVVSAPAASTYLSPSQPAQFAVPAGGVGAAVARSPPSPSASPSPPKLVLPPPARPPGLRRASSGAGADLFGKHRNNPTAPVQKPEKPEKVDDWSDERLQIEVQQASEKVWAAAEAWVEAEAEAEEQEWQLLALGINSYLREAGALSDEEDDPEGGNLGLRSPLSSHNSPKQFPGMGLGLLPGDATWEGNFVALSPEQRAIWEQTPPSRYGAGKSLAGIGMGLNRSRAASRSNLAAAAVTSQAPVAAIAAPLSTPVAAGKARKGPVGSAAPSQTGISILTTDRVGEDRGIDPSSSGSPGSRRGASAYIYRSPSESPTEDYFASGVTSTAASGGRSLHDKLSSPDRKKSISPSEALRRYEERLSNAESNRDQSIAERVQKAQIASERVRAREQREALRKATVLTAIEAKQRNVEERRNQFLKSIQSRANNETTKVHEVNLTNALNSEIIAQRLEEVETRIMAASVRRLDGLDQKRKTARKVAELSEWRLQFEKEKSERWEKLQQRLQTVKDRRAARLLELQRRAEDETRRSAGDVSDGAPVSQQASAAVVETAEAPESVAVASAAATVGSTGAVAMTSKAASAVSSTAARQPRASTPTGLRLAAVLRSGGPAPSATIRRLQATSAAAHAPLTQPTALADAVDASASASSSEPLITSAASGPDTDPSINDVGETAAQRSKSREKKEKRKLKAQLIELAREADIAALQEAIAENAAGAGTDISAAAGTKASPASVPAAVPGALIPQSAAKSTSKKSGGSLAFPDVSHPEAGELYVAARHVLSACPAQCTIDGWEAWQQLASKKINFAARSDVARYGAEEASTRNPAASTQALGMALDPTYTAPSTEVALLSALNHGGAANGTLASVVRDLVAAAYRVRAGEIGTSALTLHVMQRLYVLLQNPPASPSGGDKSEATIAAAQRSEVLLLRLALGPEVGLLRDSGELQSSLDALTLLLFNRRALHHSSTAAQNTRVGALSSGSALTDLGVVASMELEVRAEVWKLLLDALDACTESPAAVAASLQCGLGTVLVDLLQVLLGLLDSNRRAKRSSSGTVEGESTDGGSVPTAAMLLCSTLLRAVSRIISYAPLPAPNPTEAEAAAAKASQQTLDALVWYVFTLGQVPLLKDLLAARMQLWQEQCTADALRPGHEGSGDHMATSVDFLIASADYLGAICNFIRSSCIGAGSVVDSPLQLSAAQHRHSKGRQMVSILRRAELGPVLLGLAVLVATSASVRAGGGGGGGGESAMRREAAKVAFVDHLVVLGKLCGAVAALSAADLTLAQFANTPQHQSLWASAMGIIFGVLQSGLEGNNQTCLPGTFEGCFSLALTSSTALLFGKAELDDALRCLLTAITLACLRNPSLQKVCGAVAPASSNSLFYVEGGRGQEVEGVRAQASLLRRLCGLTSKYYRDKKFKHQLLPCLTAMCLDCDANILLLYRQEKLPFVLKYLEQSAKTREIYLQQQAKRRGEESTSAATSVGASAAAATTEEALYVQRLSRLLPTELWSVALVTFSAPA